MFEQNFVLFFFQNSSIFINFCDEIKTPQLTYREFSYCRSEFTKTNEKKKRRAKIEKIVLSLNIIALFKLNSFEKQNPSLTVKW